MYEILWKICNLQPMYSSSNTAEMIERGKLIRTELSGDLRSRLPSLQSAFDPIFDDLSVEASDGIGRKTEAPWVRIFSKTMSPNPREGFYIVIHFAANGSAVFFTIGCGSTIWSGGDLRAIPDEELVTRTNWARFIVQQKFKTLEPFIDQIELGAKASLPRTFEKATALAKSIKKQELQSIDYDSLLLRLAERLSEIYLAQLDQRDVSLGDQETEAVIAIAKPLKKRRRQGQGLNAAERKAVEIQAMNVATDHLISIGYECTDTSASESFDILAKNNDQTLKIEVKGTTSDLCDSIMMTRNEVELHRNQKGLTGLLIVSKIRLRRDEKSPIATGGEVENLLRWDIDDWVAEPIAFQVSRKFIV
jgi:hypothetical protein